VANRTLRSDGGGVSINFIKLAVFSYCTKRAKLGFWILDFGFWIERANKHRRYKKFKAQTSRLKTI
jgi:hypothetical protein